MAIQSVIPISLDAFFPRRSFAVGEVEPITKGSGDGGRQDLVKNPGHPLWQVRVIHADPDAKEGQGDADVKIAYL